MYDNDGKGKDDAEGSEDDDGHRLCITVVRFHPVLWMRQRK